MGQVEAQEVEPVKAPGRFPVMSEEWTKTRRDDRLGFERVLDLVGVGWVGALGPGHLHVVTLWGLRVLIRGGNGLGIPLDLRPIERYGPPPAYLQLPMLEN
jgi:hypothetical protein